MESWFLELVSSLKMIRDRSWSQISKNLLEGFQESETTHITTMKTVKFEVQSLRLREYTKSSSKLVKIDGNLNSVKYIQFLKNNLMPNLDEEGEIIQHNGVSCYRWRSKQNCEADILQKNTRHLEELWKSQPWRIASHICEDREGSVRISSRAQLKQLFKLREATRNINYVKKILEMSIM